MPCRQRLSATGRGPDERSGQGGSSGLISAHKASSTIHGRVLTPLRTAESPDQSRATRTQKGSGSELSESVYPRDQRPGMVAQIASKSVRVRPRTWSQLWTPRPS